MGKMFETNCVNGKCVGCGNCCTELLPLTLKEVETIRNYVKENKIKPYSEIFFEYNGVPSMNLMCPFRDLDTKTCRIYEVRPNICRQFKCNQDTRVIEKNKLIAHNKAKYNHIKAKTDNISNVASMRELIYGNKLDTLRLIMLDILRTHKSINIQMVVYTLMCFGRNDLIQIDKDSDVDFVLIKRVLKEIEHNNKQMNEYENKRNKGKE